MMDPKRKVRKKKIDFQNKYGKINGLVAWNTWKKEFLKDIPSNK